MVVSETVRLLQLHSFTFLSLLAALNVLAPLHVLAQQSSPPTPPNQAEPLEGTDTNELRPLTQDNSLLSLQGGQRLMSEAGSAVSTQNYALAIKKLQEARQVFNQLSNFYQDLAASFSGIDNRISDGQRRKAVETAQMRDEATYQLALVHRAQNQPELAVPLLVQIIRSQNPTRDLGKKAYQQLLELGFVDSPYPRANTSSSSSTQ
ncbi:hypothetical protein [Aerosakkonema funiforme]|uniref:Uncharacterized protein n=1 Tax=Aerosakkonema funiforme FACHB-1375 TaxID=2949571 RepID=A0A926VCH5_9CYAN|nr:hypothetical protein [Aerosakkonema funiforme]MBD2180858.1 hypothetical protein [Aerosakkonema funiforme FACHB-1375]